MAKLLKPLVVLVLLVAIAAACIQFFVLFPQRELIKERTNRLQDGIEKVSNTLKNAPLLAEDVRNGMNFQKKSLLVDDIANIGAVDTQCKRVDSAAQWVIDGWQQTKDELDQTLQDLANTRAELAVTKQNLEDARAEIVQLNQTIADKQREIGELNGQIDMLNEEKAGLESQLADKDDEIAKLEGEKASLEDDKAMLEAQLEKCSQSLDTSRALPPGTQGQIISLNKDWQFGIIDLGSNQAAVMGAELMVHRGDQFLGKVRIAAVRDDVSIVEFLPGTDFDSIKEGDDVLF
jgi:predicted RNase H-like nuclease (RuvC/YqgF family)